MLKTGKTKTRKLVGFQAKTEEVLLICTAKNLVNGSLQRKGKKQITMAAFLRKIILEYCRVIVETAKKSNGK